VLARPDAVSAVHAEHYAAGARVLLTDTFNLASPRLEAQLDARDRARLAPAAVALAHAAAPGARVAGALGPTGLARPGAALDEAAIRRRLADAAAALAGAGADLLWMETQLALAEARIALDAARATGLPAVITFAFRALGPSLRALDGTAAEECLLAVAEGGAYAAGANCVAPDDALARLAAWAQRALPIPFVAKPSAGLPGAVLSPAAFAMALAPTLDAGAPLAGGCCGASGAHLRALAERWAA
jgi:5-methyltetrahydrofolate--homocysteine methyltransferase